MILFYILNLKKINSDINNFFYEKSILTLKKYKSSSYHNNHKKIYIRI